MKLSLEIPKAHLEELSPLCDLDFALAHLVLNDKEYAQFYADQRKAGRRVVLDNGMHEMGKPLSVGELIEAAKRINPSVVCPPDKLNDGPFTYESFHAMRKHPGYGHWDLGMILQGDIRQDRIAFFTDACKYSFTLFLPFRKPRMEWVLELVQALPAHFNWPPFMHLFGMSTFEELEWFSGFGRRHNWPSSRIHMDTGKPIKWAIAGKKMSDLEVLRGGGQLDHSAKLDVAQMNRALYNIALLRSHMA